MPNQQFLLSSREDADRVWEAMQTILKEYGVVSLADVKELLGFKTSYIDQQWGWIVLGNIQVEQKREGFALCLPAPGLFDRPSVQSRYRAYRGYRDPKDEPNDESLSRDDQIRIAALSAAVQVTTEMNAPNIVVIERAMRFEAYLKGEEV